MFICNVCCVYALIFRPVEGILWMAAGVTTSNCHCDLAAW